MIASIAAWSTFWAIVLVISISVFGVLAVAVAIGGFRDLRVLLSDQEHPRNPPPEEISRDAIPREDTAGDSPE